MTAVLVVAIIAEQGGYEGPVRAVLAPLPEGTSETVTVGPFFAPEEEAPYLYDFETVREPNPDWRYQEDEGGASPQTLINDFQGISNTGWSPPDVQVAAGAVYVGDVVNSTLRFYTKAGAQVYNSTLYNFFLPLSPPSNYIFDPKIAYDAVGGRWLVMALYLSTGSQLSRYYLAVSQTSDPTGSWYYYDLNARMDGTNNSNNWADYPGMGYNSWGIFITSNQFSFSSFSYQYAKLRVLDKAAAYAGTLSGWQDFWGISNTFSWKPAQSYVPVATEYVAMSFSGSANFVSLWRVTGPAASPTLSGRINVPVGAYVWPPNASQPGGAPNLDTGDARTQDVTFAPTYLAEGSVYLTFTEENPTASGFAAARYVRVDTASMTAAEDVTFGAAGLHYFYPRVAPGDSCVGMVFSRSNTSEYVGVWYTDKAVYAPAFQPATLVKAGEGPYDNVFGGRNRWGDYSGGYIDPTNGRVWLSGEYARSGNTWGTWLADVECGGPVFIAAKEGRRGARVGLPDGRVFFGVARFDLSGASSFDLYDAAGGRLASLGAGSHTLKLSPGVYFVVAGKVSARFVVVR